MLGLSAFQGFAGSITSLAYHLHPCGSHSFVAGYTAMKHWWRCSQCVNCLSEAVLTQDTGDVCAGLIGALAASWTEGGGGWHKALVVGGGAGRLLFFVFGEVFFCCDGSCSITPPPPQWLITNVHVPLHVVHAECARNPLVQATPAPHWGWDTDCSPDVSDSRWRKGRRVIKSNPDVA